MDMDIDFEIEVTKSYSTSSTPSASTVDSVITLMPCEFDPENGYDSLSEVEDSIDSSEILESSDDELEIVKINKIYKITEQTIEYELNEI